MERNVETLVFPVRRRFQQKRLNHPRRDSKSIEFEAGGCNSGERRVASARAILNYQAPQREVRVSSSTPADAHTEHSTFEISTVSIQRRRDAEAAQCDGMARGAAGGREHFVEIRLRRSRVVAELYSGDRSSSETVLKTTEAVERAPIASDIDIAHGAWSAWLRGDYVRTRLEASARDQSISR